MKLLRLLTIFIIGILVVGIYIYRVKWMEAQTSLKEMDSFNYTIYTTTNQLEARVNDPLTLKTIELVDSIYIRLIEESGGLNGEDQSSMHFDNCEYPDYILGKYGYKQTLIKQLETLKATRTNKAEIHLLNTLILYDWGTNAEPNSVAELSTRLMMTKIELLTLAI
jgi:hypothetical protein